MINRKLKNLYSMYRFVGCQIFETYQELKEMLLQKNEVRYKILDVALITLIAKYEMIKQILIER